VEKYLDINDTKFKCKSFATVANKIEQYYSTVISSYEEVVYKSETVGQLHLQSVFTIITRAATILILTGEKTMKSSVAGAY
jgi:hypothetical protein